ncbi:MAG TPA: hypothetical protein VFU49_12715, partial [Ktedonobacteraceae bacterium]|nr:hypothetical protein [Ktedonobacteraceae bacterium]
SPFIALLFVSAWVPFLRLCAPVVKEQLASLAAARRASLDAAPAPQQESEPEGVVLARQE